MNNVIRSTDALYAFEGLVITEPKRMYLMTRMIGLRADKKLSLQASRATTQSTGQGRFDVAVLTAAINGTNSHTLHMSDSHLSALPSSTVSRYLASTLFDCQSLVSPCFGCLQPIDFRRVLPLQSAS